MEHNKGSGQYRIGLVGCAASKLDRPAPAGELYTSQLFRKASAYAAATCDHWYILSAKHGLVHPDTVLEPYDVYLGRAAAGYLDQWCRTVTDQLAAELADVPDPVLVALAGKSYRTFLEGCPWPYEIPMQGLGLGQQLGFLTDRLTQLQTA